MNRKHTGPVLAIDLRADRIGYAVFETPGHLLDYGTSRFAAGETGHGRAAFLLKAHAPSILLLRRPCTRSTRRRPRWNMNRRVIDEEAKRFHVPVAYISERALKNLFAEFNCRNKFQAAALLGGWFPEVARSVPEERKCYDPEPWTMACFDAIALGAAYFLLKGNPSCLPSDNEGVLSSASK